MISKHDMINTIYNKTGDWHFCKYLLDLSYDEVKFEYERLV